MSEPNPYEPPQELKPLTTGKVVKRGLAVAILLLLTPPAFAISAGATCAASYIAPRRVSVLAPLAVPFVLVVVLASVAAMLTVHERRETSLRAARTRILWTTPWVVAGGYAVGFVAMAITQLIVESLVPVGRSTMIAGMAAFWSMPSIALTVMCWLAWRAAG